MSFFRVLVSVVALIVVVKSVNVFAADGLKHNVIITYMIDDEPESHSGSYTFSEPLKVLVNGVEVSSITQPVIKLSLTPGKYEIKAYASSRFAAKTRITIEEGDKLEFDVFLKPEALASIIEHNIQVVGSNNGVITDFDSFILESVTPSGERLIISDFSHVYVARIENDSFRESVGGRQIGKGIFLPNSQFDVIDGALVYNRPPNLLFNTLRSLGSGEYIIDVGALDAETKLPLDGVIKVTFEK